MSVLETVRNIFKTRAISSSDIEWDFYVFKNNSRMMQGLSEISYPTLYNSDEERYLIYTVRGQLFKTPISVSNSKVEYGEEEEIAIEHVSLRSKFIVERSEEGLKIAGVCATATINRDLEIDSRDLFDSLVDSFNRDNNYYINFYHEQSAEYRMGKVKHLVREGNTLVMYGIIDEGTEYGREAVRNLTSSEDEWGFSIEFYSFEQKELELGDIKLNCHTRGVFKGVAILLEEDAASYFTNIVSDKVE